MCKFSDDEKETKFKKFLKKIYLLHEFNFNTEDEIVSFDNYDI